jgi:hypothetical protein
MQGHFDRALDRPRWLGKHSAYTTCILQLSYIWENGCPEYTICVGVNITERKGICTRIPIAMSYVFGRHIYSGWIIIEGES